MKIVSCMMPIFAIFTFNFNSYTTFLLKLLTVHVGIVDVKYSQNESKIFLIFYILAMHILLMILFSSCIYKDQSDSWGAAFGFQINDRY